MDSICYCGDSFGDRQYIDTNDPRPCSDKCLCQHHGRTESHFVFLAQKTKSTFDLIIYDATLYLRIAGALGWDIVGAVFDQGGFVVDGFALLRNCEILMQDLDALLQQKCGDPSDAYLVSSMRLLVDGFLGDEEVFRSFGHTFLHEQQHISFDHWKKFQVSRAMKDIMLLDHGFQEAEIDRVSGRHGEDDIWQTEDDDAIRFELMQDALDAQKYLYEHKMMTANERAGTIFQFWSTLGNSEGVGSTSSLVDSVAAPTGEASMTPEEGEVINIDIEDQLQVVPLPSPQEFQEQRLEPTTTGFPTRSSWQPETRPTSHIPLDASYKELQEPSSVHCSEDLHRDFKDELHDALRLQEVHRVEEALILHQACDKTFTVLLSSIEKAAKQRRGDILTLLLSSSHFDPRVDPATAAARIEMALQGNMRHNLQETGGILIEYYLRHELYKWGNIDWIADVAARHRCHWILSSIVPKANVHPTELAYQAAKHGADGPLQPTLQVLSSFEPDVFRLCIDHAAKAADTRSIRALLSAAQQSKDLRHASIIWEAAMTGDAQVLRSIFGSSARKTVLILLQEAGNIRVRQVHEIFTRGYSRLLMHLRRASCHFSINIEGLMCKWKDWKTGNSSIAWDRGITALTHLVQGNTPDNFPDVMLVLSIAKALSTTLDSTYTPSNSWNSAFLRDLARWQTLLPRSQHAAYVYCVRGLWGVELNKSTSPEPLSDPDLLDRFQSLAICLLRDTTDMLGLNENTYGNSLHSSQRRRACHGLADSESQESPPRSSPYQETFTRCLGPWNDQIGRGIDPEPNEVSPRHRRTWQAITGRLRYKIPSNKVPSIFIMMGAIFFCLLQFTFCEFLTMTHY